jgi:hypothetical protein
MNCVSWSTGDIRLQGIGHLLQVPGVLPMSQDNSVTHVPGLHRLTSNIAFERTVWHRGPRLFATSGSTRAWVQE